MVYKTYVINEDTGEATDSEGGRYYSKKQLESYHKKKIRKQIQNDYGAFVFLLFNYKQELFPNITPSNLTRLIFISTYLNYDGYLMHDNGTSINKKNMNDLLKLGKTVYNQFYKEMTDNNILKEKNQMLYLNSELFHKGDIEEIDGAMTRICVSGVRGLYQQADVRAHKTLSYIFKILPYINIKYNIACHNPQESNINLIEHLTLGEFCDIVGYDRSKAKRLANELFQCTFLNGKTVMRYVSDKSFEISTFRIFVNPKIYYAGSELKTVEVLGGF